MTDFQIPSNFYSNHDLDWINKPNGSTTTSIWENNFNITNNPINSNNIKKNMILNNPNPIVQSPIGFQSQFDSSKVPTSIKNSEFINISNSDLWSNTNISNSVVGLSNSSSIIGSNSGSSNSNNISPNLNHSTSILSPPSNSIASELPSLSGSTSSLVPPIKRKGLIKAHSEDSFQPIQQQFLQQLQQQQQQLEQQQQDDENNANSENDIEEEINGQSRYKTELCRSFGETGACRYGIKCQFAHGKEELRPVVRHPKYKTETCKTFHSTGSCPYGSRCRFIHISPNTIIPVDQNQLEVLQQQLLLQQQQQQIQPIMTRQNSSPQLSQQHQQMQPLLLQLQQLKVQQQVNNSLPASAVNSLHHSQPIPKPTITWSNSWTSEEATTAATPVKTPKKRLNVFKSFCTTSGSGNSNWN